MLAILALAALVGAPTTFRINPAAVEAGFDLKATAHTVHARTTRALGEVTVVPGDGGALALSGWIEIDAGTLDSGNERRDKKMRSESLAVDRFPTLRFEPSRFEPSAAIARGDRVEGRLIGHLKIRGVTRPATLAASLTLQGGRIVAEGTFDVRWAEYGVPDPSVFVLRVDPVAHARFRVEFAPVP